MVHIETREFSQEEWNEIASGFRDLSLMQTWEYGEAKVQTGPWEVERAVFLDGEHTVGAVQAMVRRAPLLNAGLVWINRGPLWRRTEREDTSLLMTMMGQLRDHWVDRRKMYLRIVPPVQKGEMNGNPLAESGYQVAQGSAAWTSAMIDLSKTEDQLRTGLSGNWRKQLNKAERLGVTCVPGRSQDLFDALLGGYDNFLSSRGLSTSVTPQLLRRLQLLLPEKRKMWIFEGRLGSQLLGSLLVACYGDTCMYLALALNDAGQAAHAGYVMHWASIVTMREQGYRWFDVGGADPDVTPAGILQFKQGLRGTGYRLDDEVEAYSGSWLSRLVRWRVGRARQLVSG